MADVSDERLDDAINALLNHQQQLDMDGVIVGVSRQAIHEVVDALQARRAADAKAVEVVEAAKNYVRCADARSGLSPYISENGRRGRSPLSELCDAVAALGARND